MARPQPCSFLHQAVSSTGKRTHLGQTGVCCLRLHHVPGMTLSRAQDLLRFASIHKFGAVLPPCQPAERFPCLLISTLDRGLPRAVINSEENYSWETDKIFFKINIYFYFLFIVHCILLYLVAKCGLAGTGSLRCPARESSAHRRPGGTVRGPWSSPHQHRRDRAGAV